MSYVPRRLPRVVAVICFILAGCTGSDAPSSDSNVGSRTGASHASGCVHTRGYWKNHHIGGSGSQQIAWPAVPGASTPTESTPFCPAQGFATWYDVVDAGGGTDLQKLGRAWVVARLNIAIGAPTDPGLLAILSSAEAILSNCEVSGSDVSLAAIVTDGLQQFNEGGLSAPSCDFECTHDSECVSDDTCTTGTCEASGQCSFGPLECSDGVECNGVETCDAVLGCVAGDPVDCSDGDACNGMERCDSMSGCVSGAPLNCDDGTECTVDACDPQQGCLYETVDCDDANACTVDTCDPKSGCSNDAFVCDDGNACTDENCFPEMGCLMLPVNCEDGDACTDHGCDAATGCFQKPHECDDGNECTDDSCDSQTGCSNEFNTDVCDDGNACTKMDTCSNGDCFGGAVDCDDGNPCTSDSCLATVGCIHVNNTLPCSDGDACTVLDKCGGGKCRAGAPLECDDGNVCTDDACDPAVGCVTTNNNASCSDGSACTTFDECSGGQCVGGPALVCDDGKVCTDDACDPAVGCVTTNNTASCDDGSACTTDDTCAGGQCVGGAPPNCDDQNGCTNDSCDPAVGCKNTNNTKPCDDGSACTTNDTCGGGDCLGGVAPDCDDQNPCTDDSCDPAVGCVNTHNTKPCDDGSACTTGDVCSQGTCVGGPAPDCDDGNPCTDDSCDPAVGCVNKDNTRSCDDGDACTTVDVCSGGACVGGPALECDDSNRCTDDTCDSGTGCVFESNTVKCDDGNACTTNDACSLGQCVGGDAPDCDDQNPCTDDTCDLFQGCRNTNNVAPCDDDSACTTDDVCVAGKCVGGAAPDCDDGNPCTTDGCEPASGCFSKDNSLPCDDGSACTLGDLCEAGECVPGPGPKCDDGNGCTTDSCDPATGCVNTDNDLACDDGNACTTGDRCSGGTCVGGPAPDCDDQNPCTNDHCDPVSGCVRIDNDKPCDDGDACTTDDGCALGECLGGAAAKCDDDNPCTDDACDPASGCVNTDNDVPCDDGKVCTAGDRCSGGVCEGGGPLSCDDQNDCTTDSCDPVKGCVHSGLDCDDGDKCTVDSCDPSGGCASSAVSCDDGDACTVDSCDPDTGCVHEALGCDDGDACSVDSCDPTVGCRQSPLDCDDDDACTVDSCDQKLGCRNPPRDCSDGDKCTTDACDPQSGCAYTDVQCDDGDVCTTESCEPQTGCLAQPRDCDDGDACTLDTCEPGVGCAYDEKSCDDNDVCTIDRCDSDTGQCLYVPSTTPECTCEPVSVTLGVARDFNVFACGDYEGVEHVDGRVAVRGSIEAHGFLIAAGDPGGTALIVGGDADLVSGEIHGNVHVGGDLDHQWVTLHGGVAKPYLPLDLDAACAHLDTLSEDLANSPVSQPTTAHGWGGVVFEGNDPVTNLFRVDAETLASVNTVTFDVPAGAVSIVDVDGGGDISLGGFGIFGADASHILWNVHGADTVDIRMVGLRGSLLAPGVDVSFVNGSIDGTLIARDVWGNGEAHIAPIDDFELPCPMIPPPAKCVAKPDVVSSWGSTQQVITSIEHLGDPTSEWEAVIKLSGGASVSEVWVEDLWWSGDWEQVGNKLFVRSTGAGTLAYGDTLRVGFTASGDPIPLKSVKLLGESCLLR